MTFLPPEAKEPKSKSNYTMPLSEGSHKIRVLSSAIVGYEGWSEVDGKKTPIRYKVGSEPATDPLGKAPKYFWAFVVWNYEQERHQIMEVTQKSIRSGINAFVGNEAWGNPKGYDMVITRTGMKLEDTEYAVVANPHTEYAGLDAKVDLDVWFKGDDPFKTERGDEVNEKDLPEF